MSRRLDCVASPFGTGAFGLWLVLALPSLARADAAPVPPSFEDCRASYREKGDTQCVECAPEAVGDDDSASLLTCEDQLADTEFFYVCTQDTRGALNRTEVWCDGPHTGDCACSLADRIPTWPAGVLIGLGLLALAFSRRDPRGRSEGRV